jgi:hypothetical protein
MQMSNVLVEQKIHLKRGFTFTAKTSMRKKLRSRLRKSPNEWTHISTCIQLNTFFFVSRPLSGFSLNQPQSNGHDTIFRTWPSDNFATWAEPLRPSFLALTKKAARLPANKETCARQWPAKRKIITPMPKVFAQAAMTQ